MAAGGDGNEENSHAEPGLKGKKNSKAAASFFTPLSKKTKVAKVEVEPDKNVDVVEKRKDDEFQVLSLVLKMFHIRAIRCSSLCS